MWDELIEALQRRPDCQNVFNQYARNGQRSNLLAYLSALSVYGPPKYVLVGEAAGYRGCAITGIPFTSEALLSSSRHRFLTALRPCITVTGNIAESSATIVWKGIEKAPAPPCLWNVFPWHPHHCNVRLSNRRPTRDEVIFGREPFEILIRSLRPRLIVAVGVVAAKALNEWLPNQKFAVVRHPSFGGKAAFFEGLVRCGVITGTP